MKNKKINLIKYIKNSNINDIKENILYYFYNDKLCENNIGSGYYGEIIKPNISKYMKIKTLLKTKIKVPIVVKKFKNNYKEIINISILDNILYIYGISLFFEILILLYIKKLWLKKKSIHLPLIIGYGTCNNEILLITEKHGLKELKNGYDKKIITLYDFLNYIILFYDEKTLNIKLPNNIECNIIKLLDYISISYIHTCKILYENNIYITDLHYNNIFIHELNKYSYIDNININNLKEIYYKNNNDILKIETYGYIIKLGDVGDFNIKPRDDIIIISGISNIENYKYINFQNGYGILDIIYNYMVLLPYNIFK